MFSTLEELDFYFNSQNTPFSPLLRENRLLRMEALLSFFDNPEKSFKSIHIAGSKGKGTTASLISNFLTLEGKRVGLFMSPHVYDLRERFTLNSSFFSLQSYLTVASNMKEKLTSFSFSPSLGPKSPTTFELYTLFAFLLFKNEKCEYAVLETGLGGRLDATNIIKPIATVITHLELEHTAVLGTKLKKIAREKGGIIKSNTNVFLSKEKLSAYLEIRNIAKRKNSRFFYLPHFTKHKVKNHLLNITIDKKKFKIKIPYLSPPFIENLSLSLLLIEKMKFSTKKEYDLSNFSMPARYEIVKTVNKTILIDGAHTKDSIKALFKTIKENEKISFDTIFFSLAHDKDVKEIFNTIPKTFERIIITTLDKYGKKSDKNKLYSLVNKNKKVVFIEDTDEAALFALKGKAIISLGSFYLASALKKALVK